MKEENEKIVLLDENGKEHVFKNPFKFSIEDREYVALISDENEEDVYILKIDYDENGKMVLANIEDKSEFDDAVAVYEAITEDMV
ncbi:DUF1292 domain-containing protein [Thermohalobacter berrensis]|uniref:Uncharacterized protein n=1 Tax=Thermohalobacter berrensis TaxID=99594 RepID=A0A419TAX9_9FIRM|nr:DUF1292 domain-containing protein [Thermohalobacter berrensis]RKD34612.1 hypothetical protein BET03_01950 [Thermohalobacter berrensis]